MSKPETCGPFKNGSDAYLPDLRHSWPRCRVLCQHEGIHWGRLGLQVAEKDAWLLCEALGSYVHKIKVGDSSLLQTPQCSQ